MKRHFQLLINTFILLHGFFPSFAQPITIDSTFGVNGGLIYQNPIGDSGASVMALQGDNHIVVGGYGGKGYLHDWLMVRYDLNGNLDSTFGESGKWTMGCGGYNLSIVDVAITNEKKIIVAGFCTYDEPNNIFLVTRLHENGLIDTTFGVQGKVNTLIYNVAQVAGSMILQPDGRILIAGIYGEEAPNDIAIMRLLADGSVDSSFNDSGFRRFDFGGDEHHVDLALQVDGKVLLSYGNQDSIGLTRLLDNGKTDFSFGKQGRVTTYTHGSFSKVIIALQPDGKVVVGGDYRLNSPPSQAQTDFLAFRSTTGGLLDSTFNLSGIAVYGRSLYDKLSDVRIQQDNKILLIGTFDFPHLGFGLLRLNPDGTRDLSIGPNGVVSTNVNNVNSICNTSLFLPDGNIVLAGCTNEYNKYLQFAMAKFIIERPVALNESIFDLQSTNHLFPNPFSNYLSIIPLKQTPTSIIFYNVFNQLIFKFSISSTSIINTEKMPSGLYYYQILNNHEILSSGKILKQETN